MHPPTVFATVLFLLISVCHAEETNDDESVESPEIHPDHKVTFRLDAPTAKEVKLRGVQNQPVAMKKDARGIWEVHIGPVTPGIYGYSFVVDGEAMLDPSNPEIKPERDPDESELEILSATPPLTQWQDVPHGTVHLHDYYSPTLKRVRRLRVYTPPGYEEHPNEHWPVLFLMHGTGDTEATWTEFGHAHYITDNLIAKHRCQPMILAMPDGHAYLQDEEGIGKRNLEAMESDIVQVALPYVDHLYRTLPEANHRAICGLSMGGFQSMFIGLRNQRSFAWVCGMSAYVPDAENVCKEALTHADTTNSSLKLLWHQIGKDDYLIPEQKKFESLLDQHGINHQFRVTDGDHNWNIWRGYLADLLPVLFK